MWSVTVAPGPSDATSFKARATAALNQAIKLATEAGQEWPDGAEEQAEAAIKAATSLLPEIPGEWVRCTLKGDVEHGAPREEYEKDFISIEVHSAEPPNGPSE